MRPAARLRWPEAAGVYHMDQLRSCYKCGYETHEPVKQCPKCGQRLRTAREVRVLGW